MNVLTDILYDSSSLIPSQNFKDALAQNEILPSSQDQFHNLNTPSQIHTMDRSLSSISQPNIDLYNTPSQVCLPTNMDTGFEDGSNVSVFSDSFPEIVPSWLTHDFMKVSENLTQPDILSNVSDVYPSGNDTEHLEMLDLGFPTGLASHNVNANLDDSQKLLIELPIQRFSNSTSLLMSSFGDMNVSHLNPVHHYQKFKQNTHSITSTNTSHINSVLSGDADLHLPLTANLTEQCLSTSSPILSNSQSQLHPGDVCDKLPQLSLNHLDSSLDNQTALSDIQLFRQDFANIPISVCNPSSLNVCQSNLSGIGCEPEMLHKSNTSLRDTREVAIQVSENSAIENGVANCLLCSKVDLRSNIEIVQFFRCKFCDFASLHKCTVDSHINTQHSKTSNITAYQNEQNSSSFVQMNSASDSHLPNSSASLNTQNNDILADEASVKQNVEHLQCPICNKIYLDVTAYKMHLTSDHNLNTKLMHKDLTLGKNFKCVQCSKLFSDTLSYKSHLAMEHNINPGQTQIGSNKKKLEYQVKPVIQSASSSYNQVNLPSMNGNLVILQKKLSKSSKTVNIKPKPPPVKADGNVKKISLKESNRGGPSTTSMEKPKSSHKKSWQKKMRRELGSYICECKGCNIRFRALDNLEYHKKCHRSGRNGFACPECEMTVQSWSTMAGHLWRNHKNDMELHACDQCSFRTYSMSHLENTHKKIHQNVLSYLCDTCGKKFKNGKQMRNHRVYHTKKTLKNSTQVKDFKCKVCSAQFSSKMLLHHHESSIHNIKRKSFMCNYCEFTTSKKPSLSMHMRQHTGEKPFQCDQCEYRTADHNSLRRHKMKHSGRKQYKCPFCSYSAIQASTFKDHMKKHPGHNGITFSCEVCKFKTVNYENYLQHMKDHEGLNMIQNADSLDEVHSSDDIYPLAEAMDISLSYGDNHLIPHLNKNKNMQSFFNSLGINLVYVGQESAT